MILLLLAAAMTDAQIAQARRAAPADVQAVVDRWEGCGHWAGEEPYDKARTREIARALRQLHCDRLEHDEAALRRRYSHDARLQRLLTAVHDLY